MNWIDIVILCIAVPAAVSGWQKGLLHIVGALVGLIAGILLCNPLAPIVAPLVEAFVNASPNVSAFMAKAVVVLLFWLLGMLVGRLLRRFLNALSLGLVDKILGAALHTLQILFIVSVLISLAEGFRMPSLPLPGQTPTEQTSCPIDSARNRSTLYKYVRGLYPAVVTTLSAKASHAEQYHPND